MFIHLTFKSLQERLSFIPQNILFECIIFRSGVVKEPTAGEGNQFQE